MKKYIGTKQIEAEPMTFGEAREKNLVRDGLPYFNGNPGYHVRYNNGYESWSPADAFEKAYKLAETPLDRLRIEGEELADKYGELDAFIKSEEFSSLDNVTRAMLLSQFEIMGEYQTMLNLRYTKTENVNGDGSISGVSFGVAITLLKNGFAVRRAGWNKKGMFVVKQVPAHIESNIIPNMQSLPQPVKELILKGKGYIDYMCQCLIYNENTGRADSWTPSVSDVFAEDWEIVE